MSESQNAPEQSYISRVRLKGYKSIIDTEVELKPGLNIIIGANGSGKTNFVEFFDLVINRLTLEQEFEASYTISVLNYRDIYQKKSFPDEEKYQQFQDEDKSENFFAINENLLKTEEKIERFKGDERFETITQKESIDQFLYLRNSIARIFPCIKINYQIPSYIEGLDTPLNVNYHRREKYPYWVLKNSSISKSSLIQRFLGHNIFFFLNKPHISEGAIRHFLKNYIDKNSIQNLQKFTPIQNLKINEEVEIKITNNFIEISNLLFTFDLDGNNWKWNNLSDGTKRMFHIVTEIALQDRGTYLIEEPELGIHPHQLSRLMDFIKEQSESKQIILTTHSPEVLNTLDIDELDRLIVARYDKDKGTQLRHLSDDDIKYAQSYMKDELFLSDYWVMSGFETEEEGV